MVNFASKKFLAVSSTDQLEWAAAVAPKSRKHHFFCWGEKEDMNYFVNDKSYTISGDRKTLAAESLCN